MPWSELEPGDILISVDDHSLMWVGGEKPVVHNSGVGQFLGVIRQSPSYLETHNCQVFRHKDRRLAIKASEFATQWAARPGSDFDMPEMKAAEKVTPGVARPKGHAAAAGEPVDRVVLKTPYSDRRMRAAIVHNDDNPQKPWTVDALFRALKAVARRHDGMGLSPNHGVSCSQFVTFCYQAAALELALGEGALPADLLQAIRLEGEKPATGLEAWIAEDREGASGAYWRARSFQEQQKVFKKLSQKDDLLLQTLSTHVETAKDLVPKGMQVDAKTTTVQRLYENLTAAGSDFEQKGTARQNPQNENRFMIQS